MEYLYCFCPMCFVNVMYRHYTYLVFVLFMLLAWEVLNLILHSNYTYLNCYKVIYPNPVARI